MPAISKCYVPDCTFEGNHGFTPDVGGITQFYHALPGPQKYANNHFWYGVVINPAVASSVKVGTVEERNGLTYLYTADRREAFELGVVQTQKNDTTWVRAWRARIDGDEPLANRLFKQWQVEYERKHLGARNGR
jgi:hypothetical protein